MQPGLERGGEGNGGEESGGEGREGKGSGTERSEGKRREAKRREWGHGVCVCGVRYPVFHYTMAMHFRWQRHLCRSRRGKDCRNHLA